MRIAPLLTALSTYAFRLTGKLLLRIEIRRFSEMLHFIFFWKYLSVPYALCFVECSISVFKISWQNLKVV